MPRSLTSIYVGIRPPPKNIVNVISSMHARMPGRRLFESAYAPVNVNSRLIDVPSSVMMMVFL